MKRIKRYLRLLAAFFRISFQTEAEYRGNLLFWTLENMVWLFLGIFSVDLIFGQVNSIAGWAKEEILLVLFIASLFHDLCWTLIFRNLGDFSRLIRRGSLDGYLLRPVNLRFLLSFSILEFDHYVRIAFESFLIYKYTKIISGAFLLQNFLVALFLFICALIIFYSLYFAMTVTNVWFTNLWNLVDFFHTIKDIGDKPVYIFKKGFFTFFAFIIPVGFVATFPAEALMGKIDFAKIIIAPVLATLFLFVSQKFFRFALKYYSSAST